jgi:short-subunit dehydrogenase
MKHALMIGASSGIGGALAQKLSVTHEITGLSRTSGNLNAGNGINHFMVDIAQDNPDFPSIDKPIDALIYCPGTISLKPFR